MVDAVMVGACQATRIEPGAIVDAMVESERVRAFNAAWARIPSEMREEYERVFNLDGAIHCMETDAPGNPEPAARVFHREALSYGVEARLDFVCAAYGAERVEHCFAKLRQLGLIHHAPYGVAKARADVARFRAEAKALRDLRKDGGTRQR